MPTIQKTAKRKPVSKPRRGARGTRNQGNADAIAVSVKVPPARRARYDALVAVMKAAVLTESAGFDRYWEAIGEILDEELYVAGGHESPDAFFRVVVKVPRRTAFRMVRVARYASPNEEAKYGTAVLDAALGYIEAQAGGPVKGKLPVRFEEMRIPVVRDGASRRLALTEATVQEIRKATSALTRAAGSSRATVSDSERLLSAAIAKSKALGGVSVHVSDGRVRFGAVPLTAIDEFVNAIRGFKPPPGPGAR